MEIKPSLSVAVAVRLTDVPLGDALGVIEVMFTTGIALILTMTAELVTDLLSSSVTLTV